MPAATGSGASASLGGRVCKAAGFQGGKVRWVHAAMAGWLAGRLGAGRQPSRCTPASQDAPSTHTEPVSAAKCFAKREKRTILVRWHAQQRRWQARAGTPARAPHPNLDPKLPRSINRRLRLLPMTCWSHRQARLGDRGHKQHQRGGEGGNAVDRHAGWLCWLAVPLCCSWSIARV